MTYRAGTSPKQHKPNAVSFPNRCPSYRGSGWVFVWTFGKAGVKHERDADAFSICPCGAAGAFDIRKLSVSYACYRTENIPQWQRSVCLLCVSTVQDYYGTWMYELLRPLRSAAGLELLWKYKECVLPATFQVQFIGKALLRDNWNHQHGRSFQRDQRLLPRIYGCL